jgi:uncharacterized protein YfbU (UPF0304 family)
MKETERRAERGSKSERFEMRLDSRLIGRLDRWRERQGDGASRAEAVRRLVEKGLEGERRAFSISDGEKLLLMLVADIHKAMVAPDGDGEGGDADFVMSALCNGHYWGLERRYSGLFGGQVDRPEVVAEVADILEMWSHIESSFGRLARDAQARVEAESGEDRSTIRFLGFDGNEESEHHSIARFMIEELGHFGSLKDRELNSHHPVLNRYRQQYEAYAPIRARSRAEPLRAADLIEILRER